MGGWRDEGTAGRFGEAAFRTRGLTSGRGPSTSSRPRFIAALVPLILFAGIWVRTVLNQGERDLRAYLVSHSTNLSSRIDADIQQYFSVLRAIALVPGLDAPDLAQFQMTADRMIEVIPQWSAIALVDPENGRQLVNTLRPYGSELPATRNLDIIRQVAERRVPTAFTRYAGESAIEGGNVVLLALPVIRNGEVKSVLVAALRIEAILEVVRQMTDPGLLTVLLDERDRILARSGEPNLFSARPQTRTARGHPRPQCRAFRGRAIDNVNVFTSFKRSPLTGWVAVMATGAGPARGRRRPLELGPDRHRGAGADPCRGAGGLPLLQCRRAAGQRRALRRLARARRPRRPPPRDDPAGPRGAAQGLVRARGAPARDLSPGEEQPADRPEPAAARLPRSRAGPARAFEGAVRRIGAMARVHTLLYKSPDLASIDFKDYLEDLVTGDGGRVRRGHARHPHRPRRPRPCAIRSTPPCRSPSSPSRS